MGGVCLLHGKEGIMNIFYLKINVESSELRGKSGIVARFTDLLIYSMKPPLNELNDTVLAINGKNNPM